MMCRVVFAQYNAKLEETSPIVKDAIMNFYAALHRDDGGCGSDKDYQATV